MSAQFEVQVANSATPILTQPNSNNFGTDPSGRLRVGSLTTLLDGKILNADNTLLFETVGTGTSTYANNKVNMAVAAGQYLIRQSKRFNPYFSGKAQLIEETYYTFQPQTGLTKRIKRAD